MANIENSQSMLPARIIMEESEYNANLHIIMFDIYFAAFVHL